MRSKYFKMMCGESFLSHVLLYETKKRRYLIICDDEGKITGYDKYLKEKGEGYFLLYGDERDEIKEV